MSILGGRFLGARVLDLFAGSGALGLEALSGGAALTTFVVRGGASLLALGANIDALGVGDRVTVRRADAMRFIERLETDAYDIVLADPPYSLPHAERLVAAFRERPFGSILAVEHPAVVAIAGGDTRRYGDVALTFCEAP
jgi:16S rRNA (guanine966-N2)-methyltransferase